MLCRDYDWLLPAWHCHAERLAWLFMQMWRCHLLLMQLHASAAQAEHL
jgi:hypothetical protein